VAADQLSNGLLHASFQPPGGVPVVKQFFSSSLTGVQPFKQLKKTLHLTYA
jgi:hypothetical protein